MNSATKRTPSPPAPERQKPIREQIHTAVNEYTTRMVSDAFKEIDAGKDHLVKKLEERGITGMEDAAAAGAQLVKALLLRGISK